MDPNEYQNLNFSQNPGVARPVSSALGVIGTIGAKLKLGFFRLNADYSLGVFNTATVGVDFGFR